VLQRLVQAGTLHDSSTTIFPSITPAATASIIVGGYPTETGIVGASWYEEAENQVAYYGDDFGVAAREGFRAFLRDFCSRCWCSRSRTSS
jgi:predicted AlkP superfamily pyrophosphatase or phosphodiesterase